MDAAYAVLVAAVVLLGGYQAAEAIKIVDIPDQRVNAGSTLRVDVEVIEVSGTAHFGFAGSADNKVLGLVNATIDPQTGHFVFVPFPKDAGETFSITVSVRDNVTFGVTKNFNIIVEESIAPNFIGIHGAGSFRITSGLNMLTGPIEIALVVNDNDAARTLVDTYNTNDTVVKDGVRVPDNRVVVFRVPGTPWTIDQNRYMQVQGDSLAPIANPFTDPSRRLQLGTAEPVIGTYAGETLNYTVPVVQRGVGGITWSVQEGQKGDARIDAGGRFAWTPETGDISTAPHTFEILAATDSYSQTQTLSVLAVDPQRRTALSAHDDPAGLVPGQNSITIDVLANDILAPRDGDINVTATDPPSGSTTVNADNTITYTPDDPGAHTTDTFEYAVSVSNMVDTETDTASVTVGRPQAMLAALADSVTVLQGLSVDIDVVANDGIEPPGTTATVQVTVQPQKGNATANDDGTIRYVPEPLQTGPDTLEYNVTVDGLPTGTATVSIQIDPYEVPPGTMPDIRTVADENPRPPVAEDIAFDVPLGGHITVDLYLDGRITDADSPDSTLTVNITGTPRAGTTLVSGTQLVYTPTGHAGTIDRFEYTVTDSDNATATANVTATLTGREDVLVAVPDGQITMRQGIPVDIDVLANDIIEPSDADITVNITTMPQKGNATVNDDGTIRYTPGPFDFGPVVFEYGISGPDMPESTAAVMLTINSSAPAPKPAPEVLILPVRLDTSPEFVLVFQDAGSYAYRVLYENSTALTGSGTSGTLTWPPPDGSDSVSVEIPEGAGLQNKQIYRLEILSGAESVAESEFDIDTSAPTVTPEVSAMLKSRTSTLPGGVIFTLTFSDHDQYAVRITDLTVDSEMPVAGTQEVLINGTGPGSTATGVILGLEPDEELYLKVARASAEFSRANYARVSFAGNANAAPPVETVTPGPVPELPPVAGDFEMTVEPGVPAARDLVLAGHVYDVNQEDQTLTVEISRQPAKGTAAAQNTTVTYTAGATASGSDIFGYVVTDDDGLNATGTVTAHLPTNGPPVAGNVTETVGEGRSMPLDLAPHITDPDGDIITVSITSGPQHGNTTVNGTTVIYYPHPGRGATADSFTYRAADPAGAADGGTVDVMITPNGMPVAHDLVRSVRAGQNVTVDLASAGLVSDPNDDPLTVSVQADPAHGRVTTDGAVITYAARSDSDGMSETLGYRVSDGRGASAEADFTVYIGTPPPGAIPETDAVDDQRSLRIPGSVNVDILANDVYRDEGQPPVVVTVGMPGDGMSVPHDNGTVTYTPNAGFTGEDGFEYSIYDSFTGANDTAAVTIMVIQNMRPQVTNTSIGIAPGTSVDVDLSEYVTDDIQELQDLEIVISTMPANGNATLVNGTIIRYDAGNMTGTDRVEYTVTDDEKLNATAVIAITIAALVATDDYEFVMQGSNVTIPVLDNDIYRMADPPVRLVISMLPVNGYINVSDSDRSITYTPNPGHSDPDRFEYTLFDDIAGTNDTATVWITIITPPNAVPSASDYDIDAWPGRTVTTDPVAEDHATDLDGTEMLRIGIARGPTMGNATADGTIISYTAYENASGTDEFEYSVTDGAGASDNGTITVNILRVANNPPVLEHIPNATIQAGDTLQFTVTANDTEGESLTFGLEGEPDGAAINATTGIFSWTPDASQTGDHPITVTVSDPQNMTDSQNFTVTVRGADTGPNQNPAAPDILINAELFFPSAVTPAVTDPDGDNVTITHVTEPALGILDTSMLPQISYTPNQTGIDRLNYTATDSKMGTDTGTITIFINPDGNARPVLEHIYNIGGRVGVDLNFTVAAADGEGDPLTFDLANAPDGASITAGGDFSWRPESPQNGTHTVTFVVHDDRGGADWQHVLVTILRENETNLPPVPQDIDAGVVLGGGRGFQPDISDPENDGTEIVRVYDSSLGDVDRSFLSQGIIVYVAGVLGNDEVIYTVSDGRGGFANGTISITVEEPANVRPLIEFVGDKSVNAGDELTFTVDAEDLDGFVTGFDLEGDTQGPSMSPQGVFSWTPTANDEGQHEFTILVFDDAGENSTVSITVTVRPEDFENSPPVAPDVVIMTPQDVLSIVRPTLTDPDEGDPVRITQTGDTTKGSILSGFLRAGIIIYLPNQGESGTEMIPYTIADSSDGNDTATINVFISARGNTDPILGSIYFRNINAGDPLAFDLEAEDPDGDAISYLPVGAPDGIEISPEGSFSWTPAAVNVGNHTFTVIAHDDRGGADSKTAVIRVLPAGTANQAPNAPDSTVTVAPGGSVVITPAISDPDGDRVTITDAVASGTGVVIQSEDSINYIHVATTPTETITYTVTDARGAMSTGTITVTIQ